MSFWKVSGAPDPNFGVVRVTKHSEGTSFPFPLHSTGSRERRRLWGPCLTPGVVLPVWQFPCQASEPIEGGLWEEEPVRPRPVTRGILLGGPVT